MPILLKRLIYYFYSCSYRKPQRLQLNIRNTTVDVSETFKDIYAFCTFFLWASIDNMTSSIVNKSITPYEDSKYLNIYVFFVT